MQQAGLRLVILIAAVHWKKKFCLSFLPLSAIVHPEMTHLREVRGVLCVLLIELHGTYV